MFDLQRELKADLDTRIVIVQTLLRQLDERIERLAALESTTGAPEEGWDRSPISREHRQAVEQLLRRGHTAQEIAAEIGLPLGDVELTIATIQPS